MCTVDRTCGRGGREPSSGICVQLMADALASHLLMKLIVSTAILLCDLLVVSQCCKLHVLDRKNQFDATTIHVQLVV
jgi:hypothetical protein